MFRRLDSDGGGTLDCEEIASLLNANGIHMNILQVAKMFGEAN
jgi:Ca2+-binding EF-hand superfamily protein